jgi:hypothetical protein
MKRRQTVVTLTEETQTRAEAIGAAMAARTAGNTVGTGLPTIARMAFELGLPLLEKELGIEPPQ